LLKHTTEKKEQNGKKIESMIPIPMDGLLHFREAIKRGYNETPYGWGYGKIGAYLMQHGYKLSRKDYRVLINMFDKEGQAERDKGYKKRKMNTSHHPKWKKGFMEIVNSPNSKKRTLEEFIAADAMSSSGDTPKAEVKRKILVNSQPNERCSILTSTTPNFTKNIKSDPWYLQNIVLKKDTNYNCLRIYNASVFCNKTTTSRDFASCIKKGTILKNQAFCLGLTTKVRIIGFAMEDGAVFDPIQWGYHVKEEERTFGNAEEERKGPFVFADFDYWKKLVGPKTGSKIARLLYHRKEDQENSIYSLSIDELKKATPEKLKEQLDKLKLVPCVFEFSSSGTQDFSYLTSIHATHLKLTVDS
jgi:hypothetical protein